ncbi:hypothetical protein GCM10018780_51500 [Streptomyces lanatus]|nr:hypothetical protein GCM10018780_51500 [Streptomyces lanatus]
MWGPVLPARWLIDVRPTRRKALMRALVIQLVWDGALRAAESERPAEGHSDSVHYWKSACSGQT